MISGTGRSTGLDDSSGHEQTIHYGCRQWAAYPLYLTVTWETAAETQAFEATLMVMPETIE